MLANGLIERVRAAVVEVGRGRDDAPERLRAELRARRVPHGHAVGELGPHVVEQQIRVKRQEPARALERAHVAVGAAHGLEVRLARARLLRGLVRLGRREEHGPGDEREEVVLGELWVRDAVVVLRRLVRRRCLELHGPAHVAGEGRGAAADGFRARHRELGPGGRPERIRRDAEVVEERAADEALDAHGLRLTAEAAHEPAVEVGPAADAVAVAIVGVGVGEDRLLGDLGDEADAEEGDRAPQREGVGAVVRGPPAVTAHRVVRQHAVDAALEVPLGAHALPDEEEVPVAPGGAAEDRLLVAGAAEGDVEVRPEAIGRCEAPKRHRLAAAEAGLLGLRRRGERGAEGSVDALGQRDGILTAGAEHEHQGQTASLHSSAPSRRV